MTALRCPHCLDEGHVCEDHPEYPWDLLVEGHDGPACGGAGMPCPACCSEIPQDGTHSIAEAFVPGLAAGAVVTAGCARCGACCSPVWLAAADYERLAAIPDREREAGGNAEFITAHWHQEGPAEDDGQAPFSCDMFDPASRLCTAEDRPPVCRGYPWYGQDPRLRADFLNRQCSYLADLPPAERPEGSRPLIPLEVTSSR